MPCHCGPFRPYRRKLRADISAAFPSLSAEDLNELIPNKEELNIVKIYAHKGDAVTLYVLHKNPIFFQLDKQLFPTGKSSSNSQFWIMRIMFIYLNNKSVTMFSVYTLWRYPTMLPAFVTWPPVLQKLTGGAGQHLFVSIRLCVSENTSESDFSPADLMLPGVVAPADGLPEVNRGDCCVVTLVRNR